ncbi:toll-like receptor 2-like protein [Plakobranchus ocellatus]|uniref:Toll-like receptor 2-like protein n=1 Tax=Plakobranchus ocellatus TaxID=259542 RepID=A0AAV4BJ02_9GAST|nr:toll-like receptor 2-like protein [Plakobranchus ocellatus]
MCVGDVINNHVNAPRRLSNCSFGKIPSYHQPQQHQLHPITTANNTADQSPRTDAMTSLPEDAEKEPLMGVGDPSISTSAPADSSIREFIGACSSQESACVPDLSQALELHNKPKQLDHSAPPQIQLTHSPSPGTKMKMKHLKLADAATSRFRLTFDESADGPANKNIDIPFDVSPQTPSTGSKRPSCICGEPELPPGEGLSLLPNTKCDHLDASQAPDCSITPKGLEDTLVDTAPLNQVKVHISPSNNTDIFIGCQQSSEFPSTPVPQVITDPQNVTGSTHFPIEMCNKDNQNKASDPDQHNKTSSTTTQKTAVEHPKVTICISNSQQSFIPFSFDSPSPNDSGGEDHHQQQQLQPQQHQCAYQNSHNCHQYGPGTTYFYPHAEDNYSYHPDDMVNGYFPGAGTDDAIYYGGCGGPYSQHAMLQHQDTVSAPPIQDLYRYHVFFSHCPEDREWVEHMVSHLEAPPFNYTCAYASVEDEADPATLQQRILCAAMLSERVVLVLSNRYVEETWFNFEKTLKQLTQMSLHNQRIMGVLLEDCEIPDSLGELYFLDSSDPDFFHVFTKRLKTSRIPRSSASVSSDLGQNALAPANVTNGKILTFCRLQIKVGWNSHLVPADDPNLDLPPSLNAHGIGMERTEFGEIVSKVSGIVNGSNQLPWLLSAQPMAALLLASGLWLPAFIAVLVVHVDDDSGIALPVRLAVFLFPLGLVAAAYLIKWRRSYWLTKIVRLLVQNCVDVNQALYFQGRPLFVTAAHVRANFFAVSFPSS